MKVLVAGRDRSADLGTELDRTTSARRPAPGPPPLAPEHSALSLADASSEGEFDARFLRLLGLRHGVDPAAVRFAARPGPRGRFTGALRRLLWRVLRYQHEGIATRQNTINDLTIAALRFENERRRREVERLEARLHALETRGHGAGDAAP